MIDNQRWNEIRIETKSLLFKCLFDQDKYELLMFDLNQFQMYNSQETQIKEKCYKFNAKLEIPLPKIIACLENSFVEKKENCKFTLIQNENEHELLSIKLNTKIVG
jgi:hypothetical protein